ncbi:sterile alpha motif domain-containing protein 9-like [Parambassis ranga]|uniref:Sterile alpha motif domain-containing protein 9-like n=1 Tax=Parambassis ranga TaxID=210632 RepID=A0A6P7IR39_9TELE|nr:sterile alpha motif domain-containing protein 9-like [Parambassis ranga]XP_028268033.1 sterile alpha motif domain-containing protein 9-like [Parambassis ranga]XP_028268034.1 sterile alpha motif domain-containing protein 9-like [Parambassis ranga]
MAEHLNQPLNNWTVSQVSTWLKSIGVKEKDIKKLSEEEIDGQILLELDVASLNTKICIKLGPALLIIKKRDELLNSQQKSKKKSPHSGSKTELEQKNNNNQESRENPPRHDLKEQNVSEKGPIVQKEKVVTSHEDCKPRPFDQDPDLVYTKHKVLPPECGAFNLITPCHEFKSLSVACTLDDTRLRVKFAREVFKFATGCMNTRSNGTIHFGVMDSKEDEGYVHGQIIGIPVKKKDLYVDALHSFDKSFPSNIEHIRSCVRPPRFIEVIDRESTEKKYVIEVDIVPSISIVNGHVYRVCLPNFKESTNKVEYEKDTILQRVGAKTEPVTDRDQSVFCLHVKDRDAQREEAEKSQDSAPNTYQDLGRKLTILMSGEKNQIEPNKWFILVTNKFKLDDLSDIDWLLNLNIFCVFDFDPDSKISGLCSRYLEHHAANMHSLQSYEMPSGTSIAEFTKKLHLFEQTSWIFCNGSTGFKGSEVPCDEMRWIQTKMTLLREAVSLVCKQILPKGIFQVVFLLTSPLEKPLLHTFNEFFTDMQGHEDILCICESEEDFQKWQSFAEGSCGPEIVKNGSVVGMKMSHINATLQQLQPITTHNIKHLTTFAKGKCCLKTQAKEQMYSLEILTTDHCDETSEEFIRAEKDNIERQFYHGGKVTWLNFWLAEHKHVEEIIERDAYIEACKLLDDLKLTTAQSPVNRINIYHHPGSGGSTVARHVLWKKRQELRCAVVKPSYSADIVAQHAAQLREHDEKDPQRCLPVLLLVEDLEQEYLDDLRNELEEAIRSKKICYEKPCFIVLSCRRSLKPKQKTKESPLENVSVTHKLSPQEKRQFDGKREELKERYEPEFILTFVLMSEEFKQEYIQDFVSTLLKDIDPDSVVTRLLLYVALLNTYVQNSYISQSHCEAFLGLTMYMEKLRRHSFESKLSDPAKLLFLHLKDDKTHIESIGIIHPRVAEECLKQLLGDKGSRGNLAKRLLGEKVLFEHRFGKDEYLGFLRALLIRRSKISRGDENDTLFSPLIEHVRKNESPDLAIELLKEGYLSFHKDAFFAQQIARLLYYCEKFEEAKQWAETAARTMPNNSYILDTKGQVYKKWFEAKVKALDNDNVPKTAKTTADAVETALKAIECFKHCQTVAATDPETENKSGFFAEVKVGFKLLELITSLEEFAIRGNPRSECCKYLLSDYIPEEVKDVWELFHDRLKQLHSTMDATLQWISEDLSYFQRDIDAHEETFESPEENIRNPLRFIAEAVSDYGKLFSDVSLKALKHCQINNLSPYKKRMLIYQLGGGNITSIFFKLTNQSKKDAVPDLETILSLYPSNPMTAKFQQNEIVNYIATHIALKCLLPQSPKTAALQHLQKLSGQFPADKKKCSSSALFLLTLLFWPEDHDKGHEREKKYEIVQSAVEFLKKDYWIKMKDIPQRKKRLYTHFFLGNGNGLDKFVHKSEFESVTKKLEVYERRLKWLHGEVWKMPQISQKLKSVSGWTEDGTVYLEGPQKKRFSVQPLYAPSVPDSNENITFYLGFTFRGPVACNITVNK